MLFIVVTILGAGMLVAGLFWTSQTMNFLDRCVKTKGVVIELNWTHDVDHGPSAYPVFQFVDEKTGQEITVHSGHGSYPPDYQVGQEVDLLYDPENPHDAKIESFSELWGGQLILTGLGGIFLSFGSIKLGSIVRGKTE